MTSVVHGTHATHVEGVRLTRPRGMAMVGFLTLLTGAWAAIVSFVGPVWGYHASGTQSWAWNANHWLLHLVPGAVAVVAGLLMMGQAPARRAVFRAPFFVSGLMAGAAGAWLVLGPSVWPMVYSGPVYGPASGHLAAFLNALGANLGPGVLLAIFGGMALKSVIKDREVEVPVASSRVHAPAQPVVGGPPPVGSGYMAPAPEWPGGGAAQSGVAGPAAQDPTVVGTPPEPATPEPPAGEDPAPQS